MLNRTEKVRIMNKEIAFFAGLKQKGKKHISIKCGVWSYTRVSTKLQQDNYSLENQKAQNAQYCEAQKLTIARELGGKYESASGDFSRKEFMAMIKEVKMAAKKPYAIVVYVISRFSRNVRAIALIDELVDKYGVHLIEASTGLSTETDDGKLAIYAKVLDARRDNVNRLKLTLPGMKSFLEEGNWLGNVPRGYDHFGPRAKGKYSETQKITLNAEGKLLQKAWEWKLNGERDFIIIEKLDVLGLKIRKQQLSEMWRNPFYCGINTNSLLDEPVQGSWEKMVDRQDFIVINSGFGKDRKCNYAQEKEHPARPLHGTLLCPICNAKLVGYSVKKLSKKDKEARHIHYYKCNTHTGISYNAETTTRALNTGVHQIFERIISAFKFDQDDLTILAKQLSKILDKRNASNKCLAADLQSRLSETEKNIKLVQYRVAINEIAKEVYDVAVEKLNKERAELIVQIEKQGQTLSNQNSVIDSALKYARNLCWAWVSAPLHAKQALQKLIFPNGLVIDRENDRYLTKTVNVLFALIADKSMHLEEKEKGLIFKIDDQSLVVAGTGLEPVSAFGGYEPNRYYPGNNLSLINCLPIPDLNQASRFMASAFVSKTSVCKICQGRNLIVQPFVASSLCDLNLASISAV